MKTFFTRLGSLLLCGVVFAMVGCTDFSEDIQAVDQKVDQVASNLSATDVKVENLQQTLNELSARLDADYATKAELNKVSEDLNKVIADQVAGLDAKIGKVGDDLADAVKNVNDAIATLEAADAANEAAIEAARTEAANAVATLAAALEAEKAAIEAEIKAINAQIAETNEAIKAVDAKAEENHNTLVALSDYLKNLEAKVHELKGTLDALSEYLPTVEAKIASNTAKIDELKNELVALSAHLNKREAEVDAKLNELKNTLASLSVYMDVLEASIDARFAEILNTFESLSIHLAKLEAQVALNTESSAAANAKAEELFNTILALSDYLAEEKASNDAKFQEILNTFESLSIHLAKLEAEHAAGIADNSAKIAELKNELVALSAHLEEREAGVDAKLNELHNTFLALSEHLEAEEAANAAKFAEILNTFLALSEHLEAEEAQNDAKFAELQNTLLALSEYLPTVEAKVDELKNELVALSAHLEEREPLVDAKLSELQNTLLALSVYLEEANLVNRVSALEGDLKAHKAAFEVFEAATVEQLANLFARTDEIFGQLEALSPEFAAVKSQVAELKNELVALSAHLEEREAGVDAKLNELFATFQALSPVIETMQAQIKENNATLVALSPVIETMQAQILENFNTLQSLSPEIEKLHAKDTELEAKVKELKNELLALSDYLPVLAAQIKEVKGTVESLGAEYEENKDVVDAKLLELHNTLASLSEQLPTLIGAVDAKVNELKGTIDSLSEQLPGIIAAALAPVKADVEALLDRVQSLVYVPDYDDHKATISWAELYGGESYGILVKKSVLRYRVYAKADEDAEAAAKAIENAWTPESFYYEVEPVKRAWTRSATVPASLEITDVWAEGEYLNVEVLAKNFNPEFFFSYWYGDNYPRFAMENTPEEGKPVDEKSSYSVSLVLTDGNNNRSTEYTNLVPAYPEFVTAVILAGDKKTDITNTVVDETLYLQYDLEETVTPLDGHAVYFQEGDKTYSVEDFQKAGYDVMIGSKAISILSADNKKTIVPAFVNMSVTMHQGGFKYVPNPETKYWVVSLEQTLDRESFLKINGTEEQDLEFNYIYTVNGLEIFAAQNVEISKKIVNVNLPVIDVPWTVAEAESLMAGGVTYSVDLVKEQTYDIETAADKSLGGYTLASVMNRTAAEKKVYINGEVVETADIKIQVTDRQETTYKMILGNRFDGNAKSYSFPVNNNDEIVDWNVYKATWTYELEDMKVFVTGTMQLGEQAPVQNVPVAVDFKLMKGANGWLTGSADVLTAAYEQFKNYLGYADEATDKAKFLALFVGESNASRYKETTVNEKAVDYMTNTPYTGFEPQNFKLHRSSLKPAVDYKYPVQVIQQVVKPWFGIDFNFIVNGNVVLPKDVLNYSTVDFVTFDAEQNRWEVEVDGDIVADQSVQNGRKYTIDQADLGKYFYVSDEAEYGLDRMLTVKFEVLTENAPLPETTDVVNVFEDATSQINVLEEGKSVIKDWTNGGNFVGNEIKVKATLLANGFAIDDKEVTLFTIDPLTFSKVPEVDVEGVDIQVERVPGKDAVVKSYRVLSLTSVAEEGNLINTGAKTGAGLFFNSHADEVYGAEFIMHPEDQPTWTSQILGVYTKDGDEKVAYPGTKYDFTNGTITLKADDGLLLQPIYAEVEYTLRHNYNYGKDETVTVVIKFVPNNEY